MFAQPFSQSVLYLLWRCMADIKYENNVLTGGLLRIRRQCCARHY